jgi:rod shape-determining protein MreC
MDGRFVRERSHGFALSRYKNILFLVAVLVAQIIGLAVQVRRPNPNGGDAPAVRLIRYWAIGVMSPPEKAIHGSGSGARSLWSNYLDLRHVRRQNQELTDQVRRLQLEQATLLEDARQGQRLQTLLAFKEHYIYSTVPAEVIGTSGTDQSRILYIDKGAKDGLKPDMAVITPDGIVGKLKDVFANTSQVLVISDQTSGAGVVLESTRLRGVLRGNALGQPQIINMLPDERVKPGERVVTSGGDQIYPRGLPVGVVDQVVPDTSNPPFMDILIKPAANLGHLEELLVITQAGDQMPEKEKQDLAQSAAEGAIAATQQRASDILAERLPGLNNPGALADAPPAPDHGSVNPDTVPVNLHPPPALHADHYSPNTTPQAGALTPGQSVVDPKYVATPASTAPAASSTPAAKGTAKADSAKTDAKDDAAGPKTDQPGTAKPHHASTSSTSATGTGNAPSGDAASPGTTHPAAAKPKVPKTPPADQPAAPEPGSEPPATPANGTPPQ